MRDGGVPRGGEGPPPPRPAPTRRSGSVQPHRSRISKRFACQTCVPRRVARRREDPLGPSSSFATKRVSFSSSSAPRRFSFSFAGGAFFSSAAAASTSSRVRSLSGLRLARRHQRTFAPTRTANSRAPRCGAEAAGSNPASSRVFNRLRSTRIRARRYGTWLVARRRRWRGRKSAAAPRKGSPRAPARDLRASSRTPICVRGGEGGGEEDERERVEEEEEGGWASREARKSKKCRRERRVASLRAPRAVACGCHPAGTLVAIA